MNVHLPIHPTAANLAHALETFLGARQAVADLREGEDQEVIDAAVGAECNAQRQLHALVIAAAGPVPSAVMIDGTLIVASVDEYGEESEYPIVSVIEPSRFAPFSTRPRPRRLAS